MLVGGRKKLFRGLEYLASLILHIGFAGFRLQYPSASPFVFLVEGGEMPF